mgnify:FL=1|jgi:hypothetical protein
MKKMNMKVINSNLGNLQAYALSKKTETMPAKECIGATFKLKDYVITHNVITDSESGEVVNEMDCLTMSTEDGKYIGTNSQTLISNLLDIISICEDAETSYKEVTLTIAQGKGKNGNFNTIEIVL